MKLYYIFFTKIHFHEAVNGALSIIYLMKLHAINTVFNNSIGLWNSF